MTRHTLLATAAVLALTAAAPMMERALDADRAHAHEIVAGDLTIDHAWARLNIANRPSAGFMKLINKGAADTLTGATSPLFGRIELHTHTMADGVMQMRPVESIAIPAEGEVELKPGGLHLMLFDPTGEIEVGSLIPVTLTLEKAGDVEITVIAEDIASGAKKKDGHEDHGDHSGHGEAKTN